MSDVFDAWDNLLEIKSNPELIERAVLDKIRAEIEQMNNIDYVEPVTVDEVLQIIDKYIKGDAE